MKKKKEENKIYLIKGGKQVISDWEFMQQTGMLDWMKQKGITINPTHSFELLKQTRLELFEKAKQNFSEERKMKKLETSDFEIKCMYYSWLKGELQFIEQTLSDTYPNGEKKRKPSTSDQIEILKYKQFVNDEMIQAEKEINPPQQTETKAPTAPAIALFCNLINEAEIIKKENNEIPEIYCKHICKNYNLKYTDRVRQNFNGNKSKKHYKELTELILPCIDEKTKDKIQKHLDSKNPPKQKLYA